MAKQPIVLIANPGSASRKYALFDGVRLRASLHFEWSRDELVCTLLRDDKRHEFSAGASSLSSTANHIIDIFRRHEALQPDEQVARIGLRIVAPGSYFLEDQLIDNDFVANLESAQPHAPIHIAATLEELRILHKKFAKTPIIGISDSAFHITKPDYAWNYGIALEDADRFEIKRFGYHGISVASVAHQLVAAEKLSPKVVVCHLGSGASVTALRGGKSIDNTMGYSPLEGVIMSTRSGSIDPTAVRALKEMHKFDDQAVEEYLNSRSGLLGLGGSSDTRKLLEDEKQGDNLARLALATYVYSVQKAIGQMTAALGGIDALVFTGTVGERSAVMRARILKPFHYLEFMIDEHANRACTEPDGVSSIGYLAHSKPILAIPANESIEMARRTSKF